MKTAEFTDSSCLALLRSVPSLTVEAAAEQLVASTLGRGNRTKYWYDSENRRRRKVYPAGAGYFDEFFYDLGHQMLEDRAQSTGTSPNNYYPIDEYIWLDGRPIAFFRSKFDAFFTRQSDLASTCARLNDPSASGQSTACGLYFVVSDHIGKPVLVLNSSRLVSGVGEYETQGYPNRMISARSEGNGLGYHSDGAAHTVNSWTQPTNGLSQNQRVHFSLFDTETSQDVVQIQSGVSPYPVIDPPGYSGYHRGNVWTNWVQSPVSGVPPNTVATERMQILTNVGNCPPNGCPGTWSYSGVYMREYEYQRYAAGVAPVFPPFRFPGQYWDAETDWFENWNRFYEPLTMRYLSQEPMLIAEPRYVTNMARAGLRTPAYAYAQNNPLAYFDADGRACEFFWSKDSTERLGPYTYDVTPKCDANAGTDAKCLGPCVCSFNKYATTQTTYKKRCWKSFWWGEEGESLTKVDDPDISKLKSWDENVNTSEVCPQSECNAACVERLRQIEAAQSP